MDETMSSYLAGQNSTNHGYDGMGYGGSWIWVFLIIALFMGGGWNNGWNNGNAGLQGALTRGEMYEGFNSSNSFRNQNDLIYGQFDLQKEVMQNRYEIANQANMTNRDVLQNRYDAQIAACNTQRDIMENRYTNQLGVQQVQAQLAQEFADLKTATHAEGEATRDLINANTMQELRTELQRTQLERDNLAQTNTLLNAINKTPVPAYLTCSPYANTYNPYSNSCNCGNNAL